MEAGARIGWAEEFRLIEREQCPVPMRIIGGWLKALWVEVAQQHLSRLVAALDHKRRLVLTAGSYRKRAVSGKPINWHPVIGRRPSRVPVELEVWLVNAEPIIEP